MIELMFLLRLFAFSIPCILDIHYDTRSLREGAPLGF